MIPSKPISIMKKIYFIFLITASWANCFAQLSTNEQPVSFGLSLKQMEEIKKSLPSVTMPPLDMEKIEEEDKEDEEFDMPRRFGFPHFVDYNLTNSGIWYELPNGDKLWQLNVICPGALSVNFCYDKFWIPEGGKFFVFSKDKKHSIGAFTSNNNKGDSINVRGFATGLVYGDDVILEYYQPKEVTSNAIISIDFIVQGYRNIIGSSGGCQVNVNCSEGHNWQNEKNAVAVIIVEGCSTCTGSLITTTNLNEDYLFLTANHCLIRAGKDAIDDPDLDYTFFWWKYEEPGCDSNSFNNVTFHITSGATVLANNHQSDFALLRLTERPISYSDFTPFFLGWDRSGNSGNPGVCIHHPGGDLKKISTVAYQPLSTTMSWKVQWKSTENGYGTTEQGSSGSPLLTAEHKVIGQLFTGSSSCSNLSGEDYFRRFDISWNGNNNDSIQRRLSCWLDSLDTGLQTMDGLLIIPSIQTMSTDQQLYNNIHIKTNGQLTIQSNVELMGNSQVIVESGGIIIIDGGTLTNVDLVLKPGACLRIINNGFLGTRNGFDIPIGAIVDVEYGQIK